MRRFGTATVLAGLLLLAASWSLSASDTPKAQRPGRRKAVASKQTSKSGNADVKLENLYVDSEIGQVFTVNLGRADKQASAGESVASLGSVQIYRLGSSESEPPETAATEPTDSADPAVSANDDQNDDAMEPAPEAAVGDEAMEPAADDSAEEPAAEPAAAHEVAPQASQTPPQADPAAAKPPAAKEPSPKTPPPADASQAPPPPPPSIR